MGLPKVAFIIMTKKLGIGLVGFGTVGTGVWETLERNS